MTMRAWGLGFSVLSLVLNPAIVLAGDTWDCRLSSVPDALTLSPGSRYAGNPIGRFTVHVECALGPVEGSFVEVEISSDAEVLVSWCRAPHGGTAGQVHPILTGFTDANGNITFEVYGGGCLDPADFFGSTFIAQVRADGIVLDEPFINSPDAVNFEGKKATDTPPLMRCDPDGFDHGTEAEAAVALADAVFHTPAVKLGLREACSKFTPPFNGNVGVSDAVFLTPYIKNGNICNCQ